MTTDRTPEGKVRTRARATITIEFPLSDVWGPDAPLEQVHRQGVESARGELERLFTPNEAVKPRGLHRARILSVSVDAILASSGDRE